MVAKCKNGSPAAIAGVRPFELVTKVDDAPVADARAFLEATRGRESLTLTVRRLTKTRIVRVSLSATEDDGAPAFDGVPVPASPDVPEEEGDEEDDAAGDEEEETP